MMERQWYALRKSIKSRSFSCEGVANPFFRRLLVVLADQKSGPADRAKAYYDALGSAHALQVHTQSLPLVDESLYDSLAVAGIEARYLTGEVQLDQEELLNLDKDVFALQQRRFINEPPIDVALKAKLPGEEFSTYNGRGQQAAIRTSLTSPDDATLFINLPTGCGKTLLVHALMLMTPSHRLTLVIVPTVALALEQGNRATELLKAAGEHNGGPYVWFGGQSQEERTALRECLKSGRQRILFCAPEAAMTSLLPILFNLAKQGQFGAFIVDEAHLIDQWGAGFRPDFQLLPSLVESLQGVAPRGIKKILMSATFNPATMETLKGIFCTPGQEPLEVNASFLRPEPSYYLTRAKSFEGHKQLVLTHLRRMPRPLILYVTTRDDAEKWYGTLSQHGYKRVGLFHGNVGKDQKKQRIIQWTEDRLDIMVATSAFGVGMDKGDVRSVLHAAVPENIDRYYQECGRGGRDGRASMAHLIYHSEQIGVAQRINDEILISTGLGYRRWWYMHQNMQSVSEGRFRIDLRAQHDGIGYDSRKNIAWNWRTLLLMKRAGFVKMFFAEPQFPRDEVLAEDQLDEFFSDYFSHVEVEITHDGHLDENAWQEFIEKQREKERRNRSIGFSQLKRWLDQPNTKICNLLADFYTTNGFAPERACGGCPGCRNQGNQPFTPTLGAVVNQPNIRCHVKGDSLLGQELRVYYHGEGQSPRVVIHKLKHLIVLLLQKGMVEAIRAQSEVHQLLNKTLSFSKFWCAIMPDEPPSVWNELVLVMPDETNVPRAELCLAGRTLFIPKHLPDPRHQYRLWFETDPQAISLEDFERRLGHVDN